MEFLIPLSRTTTNSLTTRSSSNFAMSCAFTKSLPQSQDRKRMVKLKLSTKLSSTLWSEAWCSQGELGRWPLQSPMGVQNNSENLYLRNPFFASLWLQAMILMEVGIGSLRRDLYSEGDNEALMRASLDLVEEHRSKAKLRVAAYQQCAKRFFDSKVRRRDFRVGDLILKEVFLCTRKPSAWVFGPNWEGPYRIAKVIRPRTYHLKRLNGSKVPRAWNTEHLRPYYQ